MQSGSLWGRTEPMARALATVRAAQRHGLGGVVGIGGATGVGKTALLREVGRQASRIGLRVLTGYCDPAQQTTPGGSVIALLRAGRDPLISSGDFAELVRSAAAEPLIAADRIGDHLADAAADGPLLVSLDDLHRADAVGRLLLRTVISRLAGLPVVWVLAGREELLFGQLTGSEGVRLEQIRLQPLETGDLVAMATDRLGRNPDERTVRYLDATGGNPELAVQLIDTIARGETDSVPAEFSAAITGRLARLGEGAQNVVRLLAVADTALTIGEINALLPDAAVHQEQVVPEILGSGLITATDETLACRHELVRDAIRATMRDRHAKRLHRSLAEYYLAEAEQPLQAASHARAAAEPGDLHSGMVLLLAAESLVESEAERSGELAQLAMQTFPCWDRAWPELARRCLAVLCRTQRATDAMTVADLILARVDDDDVIGAVETDAAQALWLSGRITELIQRTDSVLARPDLTPTTTARLRSARALAGTRIATGAAAAREARAALACSHAVDDREAVLLALQAAGEAAKNEGRHEEALRHFRELRTVLETSCLAEEITELQILDRYDHAQLLLDRAGAAGRVDAGMTVPALHCAQMWQHFYLGRFAEADVAARALNDLGRQLGNAEHALDAALARTAVALLRGDVEAATAHMSATEELVDAADGVRRPALSMMRGWLAAGQGDLAASLRILRPVVAGAGEEFNYWPVWPCWSGLFFDFGTMAEDDEFAADTVETAELAAARNPGVASLEGIALNLRGSYKADLDILARSVQILDRSPRPILRARGAESYGRALLAAGEIPAGLAELDRAWDEYHRVGASYCCLGVQRAMRSAGVRRAKWSTGAPAAAATTGWEALTPTERRVATLIAGGHTNKSAATELGISINTVGTHLRAVFAKLGVRSRVQLANIVNHHASTGTATP
ncbi:helix-turn-helix transcriptional regulator [Nocardia tengchongensis]|uniref:helix-turn-helix transcriptional regulator n=1 Tax=Nocardia tengchongensis TaxID=2055889 RepID=UPI0036B228AE